MWIIQHKLCWLNWWNGWKYAWVIDRSDATRYSTKEAAEFVAAKRGGVVVNV